jgi:hypothetical protein
MAPAGRARRRGLVDKLGRRNQEANEPTVGEAAAMYGARCVVWGLCVWLAAVIWMAVFIVAISIQATAVAAGSLVLLVVLFLALSFLSVRSSTISAKLAADHLEPQLGFRPKWWWCYSTPRGWRLAIARQQRWHARGQWPVIPW